MAITEHYVEAIAHKLNLDTEHVRQVGPPFWDLLLNELAYRFIRRLICIRKVRRRRIIKRYRFVLWNMDHC